MTRNEQKITPRMFNAKMIKALSKPGMYPDEGCKGLYVQLSKLGGRSWLLRFMLRGQARAMGLGGCDIVSPSEAREAGRNARAQLRDGKDPIELRREGKLAAAIAAKNSRTFEQCLDEYHSAHRSEWKSEKDAKQWRASVANHAAALMDKPVHLIDTALVLSVLEHNDFWMTKRVTADRVRNRIESVLDMAGHKGYRSRENPAKWVGHLEHSLSKAKVAVENHPALPYAEIAGFMAALRAIDSIDARALEFLILNASRSGEVRGARWDEIDMQARTWTIPAERMKRERAHVVPLSDASMAILEKMAAIRKNDFVFPAPRANYINNLALPRMLERVKNADVDADVHGFRATFRTWASDKVRGVEDNVKEVALAHKVGDATRRAYDRGELLEKRRELMDLWARYCDGKMVDNVFKLVA